MMANLVSPIASFRDGVCAEDAGNNGATLVGEPLWFSREPLARGKRHFKAASTEALHGWT
jgi:hypothetical protein